MTTPTASGQVGHQAAPPPGRWASDDGEPTAGAPARAVLESQTWIG
jgi:hypothetical protein